MHCILALL